MRGGGARGEGASAQGGTPREKGNQDDGSRNSRKPDPGRLQARGARMRRFRLAGGASRGFLSRKVGNASPGLVFPAALLLAWS